MVTVSFGRRFLVVAFLALAVVACRKSEPVKLGFVAGLTGRVADLGVAGRNGVQLAVEQRNASGGIKGQLVELIVKDDGQNPETAKRAVGELIGQKVEVIVGPMTSSMAMAVMPQINASQSILLSPTVTTTDLGGKDDNFLRVIAMTGDYASKNARYQFEKLGVRTVSVIYDRDNKSYTESWLNGFKATFSALGGRIILTRNFPSGKETVFLPLVRELLAARADSVLIISNAVDSALICQQLRKLSATQRITMSEWASTERFTELAGAAAEGVVVSQFLDRNDTSPGYRDFVAAYRARYHQDPGFAGVAGYDAAQVALTSYELRKEGESIKSVIINRKNFHGVQQQLNIDRFGDADRKTFITQIRGNRYLTVE